MQSKVVINQIKVTVLFLWTAWIGLFIIIVYFIMESQVFTDHYYVASTTCIDSICCFSRVTYMDLFHYYDYGTMGQLVVQVKII